MDQATHLHVGTSRSSDARIIAGVSAAHFVSHYYILLLAPLFAFVRAEYNVSYTELALALAVFNLVSGTLQTPAGFVVDLISARLTLIGGLVLGSLAFVVVGLVDSYWVLVAMFAVAGVANTVYHPADYAILSNQVSPQRMAQAYSIHTFAGFVGTAVVPVCALFLERLVGWRGAFIASATLGLLAAAFLATQRDAPAARSSAAKAASSDGTTADMWQLLLSGPILRNFAFFTLLSVMNAAIYYYTAVALGALYGTPAILANAALTTFLAFTAIGVLAGGYISTHTQRHNFVVILGLVASGLACLLIGVVDLPAIPLFMVMAVGGFCNGVVMPARDLIVRAVTPPGSFGKVFGFVTTGFSVGLIVAPVICGAMMDHGYPRGVFLLAAAAGLLTLLTLTRAQPPATGSRSSTPAAGSRA
jgi:FSR family fosmidomycin resistance protein-like MFS transporter